MHGPIVKGQALSPPDEGLQVSVQALPVQNVLAPRHARFIWQSSDAFVVPVREMSAPTLHASSPWQLTSHSSATQASFWHVPFLAQSIRHFWVVVQLTFAQLPAFGHVMVHGSVGAHGLRAAFPVNFSTDCFSNGR